MFLFIFVIPLLVAICAFIAYKYLEAKKRQKIEEVNLQTCPTKVEYQNSNVIFIQDVWVSNPISTCKSYPDWERDIRYKDVNTFKANYNQTNEGKLADQQLSPLSREVTQQKLNNQSLYEAAKGMNMNPDDASNFIMDQVRPGSN